MKADEGNAIVRTALVVDDEERIRELLQMSVQALGYHVEEAVNGQEALSCISRRGYDLVVCDLLMPHPGGDELFRICRRQYPAVANRFVFLNSYPGGVPATEFAMRSGQPLLSKPWRLAELRAAIDQVTAVCVELAGGQCTASTQIPRDDCSR